MARETRLCCAPDFLAAWEEVILPWLADRARLAWQREAPTAVLAPSMAYAQFLKSRILDAGIPLLAVRFLTPGECWEMLHAHLGIPLRAASREALHLLLAAAAERFPDIPSARSVALDPSGLMRALDLATAAGWSPPDLGLRSLTPMLDAFADALAHAGLATAQAIDRQLAAEARRRPPLFADLLVVGFDGRHWSVWNLLNAAVAASRSAAVALFEPRASAEASDQVWVNSWEQEHGEALLLAPREQGAPLRVLAEAMEAGASCGAAPVEFLIAESVPAQSQAVVAAAIRYLASPACTRLGILFPGPGPLHRETARQFAELGIAHNDAIGHPAGPCADEPAWQAWLALQREPGVDEFLRLLDLCPAAAAALRQEAKRARADLTRAYEELMVNDLAVLAASLGWPLADSWLILPPQAAVEDLMARTSAAWRHLAPAAMARDPGAAPTLGGRLSAPPPRLAVPVSRELFARWLGEISARRPRVKDETGRHAFARVHLLPYDKAEWQTWSHLILAGLNQNSWPPDPRKLPFMDQGRADALNAQAVTTGSQGEGQSVVKPGRGLIVGPAQRSAQTHRQFHNILESATHAASFFASATQEEDPSRPWNPSDLFVRAHAAATARGLSEEEASAIRAATTKWLAAAAAAAPQEQGGPREPGAQVASSAIDRESIRNSVLAYRARRDPSTPFGPYDFGLASPPRRPIALACTAWEKAVRWPEIVWMDAFLGVREDTFDAAEIPWRKVVGLWVHRWLRAALTPSSDSADPFHPLPDPVALRSSLEAAAQHTLSVAGRAFRNAGRTLPHWWCAVHLQALAMARRIAGSLPALAQAGWDRGAAEWPLPPDAHVRLPDGSRLRLIGRIDLALSNAAQDSYWVVDYKTGSTAALSPAPIAKGRGLQVLLYGLALKTRGATRVQIALSTPGDEDAAVAQVDELAADARIQSLLGHLVRMQETGVFGMRGDPRSEFGFVPGYPLATLAVDADLLELKWQRTFGEQASEPDG